MSIEEKVKPHVLTPEEEAYRKELRDAVAEITVIYLRENQAEIVKRAEERVKFMRELAKK